MLLLDLVQFGFYCKNMQIYSKSTHIFLIGLDIKFSQNRTKSAREHPYPQARILDSLFYGNSYYHKQSYINLG